MATIKITYDLSENGRRASLLAGGDGREHQVVEVPATPELLAIAHIATDGSAAYSLAGRGSIDYDAPIADPATIAVAHAAAQIAAKAQEEQQREADRREADARYAQNRAAKAARTTEWRGLATRYLAGEELSVQTERNTTIQGVRADETDVTAAEWQAVDREYDRRATLAREQAEQAAAASRATRRAAWLTWLRDHGATAETLERCEAGVLPRNEGEALVCDALLPATVGEVREYEPHASSEIKHDDDCDAHECGESRCKWTVSSGDDRPLTSSQWGALKVLRTHYKSTPATVDVRVHTAELSCNCANPEWLVARVQLALPELDLTVRRQYAL